MVVGALIFVLGIDLTLEVDKIPSLADSRLFGTPETASIVWSTSPSG
jgi:hypothetical protein